MEFPPYSTILLLLAMCIFSMGSYFAFRLIQSLTNKQNELIKKVGDIQYRLNEVKTNVDRASTTLWSFRNELYKITGVMEELEKEMGEYDENEDDED